MRTDKNAQSTTATPPREKLTIDERLNRLQSLINTVSMACTSQSLHDLAAATEIASGMVDEIAEELENANAV